MKSSKWILGLTVVVLMLALAPSGFAQVNIQIFNAASPGEIGTIRQAVTSDPTSTGSGILVSGSLVASSNLTTTNLIMTFPAPITTSGFSNNTLGAGGGAQIPSQDPILITGASGVFAGITAITTVNWSAGTVIITLPGTLGLGGPGVQAANNQSGSFRLVGVRIDANGKTAPLTVSASLSSSANNYILTTTSVPAINALGAGIGAFAQGVVPGTAQTNNGTFLVFTNQSGGTPAHATASLVITEGIASAWRTATQESISGTPLTNGTNIQLTFTGIPAGMSIAIAPVAASSTSNRPSVLLSSPTVSAPTSTAPTANVTVISFTGPGPTGSPGIIPPNLTAIDYIGLQLTLSGSATGTIAAGTMTVTATNAPVGAAFDSSGVPTIANGFPNFLEVDTSPVTIGTIGVANSTLLIPYALSGFGNYNTGIAIANTTADPFGVANGGAVPSAGPLTFTFYPNSGASVGTGVTYSTSAAGRPGGGVDSSGNIPAGSTYAVLLGDLLTAAGITGNFQGYAFVQASFLDVHGVAYIYQGPTLTSAVPILVVPPPVSNPRGNSFGTGAEQLNN